MIRKMNCDETENFSLKIFLRINDKLPSLVLKLLASNDQEALTSLVAVITDFSHYTQIFLVLSS